MKLSHKSRKLNGYQPSSVTNRGEQAVLENKGASWSRDRNRRYRQMNNQNIKGGGGPNGEFCIQPPFIKDLIQVRPFGVVENYEAGQYTPLPAIGQTMHHWRAPLRPDGKNSNI